MKSFLVAVARRLLSLSARRRIVRWAQWPPVGWVRLGSLRRVDAINPQWGSERGSPIDRFYIQQFLGSNSSKIRGHVLEIGTNTYTVEFGRERVTKSDVLHVSETREPVTMVGDLTSDTDLPSNAFNCVILTQTLQFIFDVTAAVKTVYRILRPGGVALVTLPGITQISRHDMDRWGQYWAFTSLSARRLFEPFFPPACLQIAAYGNVLAAIAFLHGLVIEDLSPLELEHSDPDYELIITICATKPAVES